ncbi:MAG: helix-turn-helix transcriptional regulator [Rhodospirillaceae bacterium]
MTIPWKGDLLALQARIYKARRAQKITQAQAGKIIGVCDRTYRDWEGGETDIPASSLFLLAAHLGIRVFEPGAENRKNSSGFGASSKACDGSADFVLRSTKEALPPLASGGR